MKDRDMVVNKQAESCIFKNKSKEECNLATEMICNYKECTLCIDGNSEKGKSLKKVCW